MKTLTPEVLTDLDTFCHLIIKELRQDAAEYGEACLTVACSEEGEAWNYQTGDNSFTGGAYGLPHWAVCWISEDTTAEELLGEIINQLNDLLGD